MYIDTNTGQLYVFRNVDYEQVKEILLVISATDQCPSEACQLYTTLTVLIAVLDVNDNAPKFPSYQPLQVYEDEDVGYMLASLVATDIDSNVNKSGNNRLTYTIKTGNIDGVFQINDSTGVLTIAHLLDWGLHDVYNLEISARDHGTSFLETTTTLVVWVLDVNDNSPHFQQSTYQCSVLENSNISTIIMVSATDADTGNNSRLTYSIPDGIVTGYFAVDPSTGVVTLVTNKLDREQRSSYVIPVYVQDAGYPILFDMATLIINVTDVNDSPPTFTQENYYTYIPENTILDMVYIFVAHDADVGDNGQVKYSITGGNDEDKFKIDLQTGILSCQKPLDRETVSNYELTITATDGKFLTPCKLIIGVIDLNDNKPSFKQLKYTITSMLENAIVGTTVVSVSANDIDEGKNGMVTYSFSTDTDASVFAIDSSGVITTRSLLDREKKSNYSLDIVATDGGITDQLSGTVRIEVTVGDINDNSPVFTQVPYTKVVPLNTAANTPLLTVVADDKDYGDNAKVLYAFSNLSDAIALNYFQINAQSGIVSTKLVLGSSVSGYHNLKVIATDGGTIPLSTTGVVEITVGVPGANNSFAFQNQSYSTECQENAPVNSPVIKVSVNNHSSPVTYSFAGGNIGDAFIINTEGLISVSNPAMIDYEASHSIKLVVAAVSGSMYAYTTVWINLTDINDNPPVFSQDRYNTKFSEEQPKNTSVMQVTATDADSLGPNSELVYNIILGNDDEAFIIYPPSSGIIQTNLIVDYEIRSSYTLTIEAKDNGIKPKSGTCIVRISLIDINDNPPKFPNTIPVNISEDADVGTLVAMVTANDVDVSSKVTYNFSNLGNPDAMFMIDPYKGSIYLARRLDYELRRHYAIGLQVSDGKYSDYTILNLYVQDVNDNAPVFSQRSYKIALDELTAVNTKVLQVNATDVDNGANAAISYSLANSSADFYINSVTGVIYTSSTIQYQPNMDIIQLVVRATDGSNFPLSAFVAVNIQVTSLNKYPPVFLQDNYTASVVENASSGSIVAHVQAHDNDLTHRNKEIIHTIVDGNIANVFTIDQRSGDIMVNTGLDRELVPSYNLKVMAKDRGSPSKSATAGILIQLQDVNDNIPYFEFAEYHTVLNESFPSEDIFLKIKTYDMDTGENGKITHSITSGNEEGLFSINGITGELFITPMKHLDYELSKYHQLVVKAMDCSDCMHGTPIFSNITTVHINVSNINEFSPEFPVGNYIEDIKENNLVGLSVFEAHANDRDGDYFGIVSYTLAGTTLFSINSTTGLVTANVVFDYETAQQFNFSFKITATDKGAKSATINVMLYLQDVDEFSPIFGNASYMFSIPGDAVFNTLVGVVHATDADKGYAGVVIYKFSETNGYFGINSTTGEVRVKHDLNKYIATANRKKRETISLIVVVSNGMDDSLLSSCAVIINVNRACPGCALISPEPSTDANSSMVTIVVVVIVIVGISVLITVILVLFRRWYQRQKAAPPGETTMCVKAVIDDFDSPFSTQHAPNYKDSIRSSGHNMTNGTASEVSHRSGSSGRGSAEDDEDEELAMINFNTSCLNNSNGCRKNMPDSGIQEDDNTSEPSVQNHQDYLARLGIDTAKINFKAKSAQTHSVESLHQFSDSGGRDGDGLENIDSLKLQGSHISHDSFIDKNNDMGFHEPEHNMVGSLSNVINSEEEYSGSYNWDYLLDWGPQYLPLAHVFSEIARLKDDKFQPKKQTIQIVPQKQLSSNVGHQVRAVPPPMITSAPPQVAGQPLSRPHRTSHSSGMNSMHNSTMNTSLPSMPRSPISHESSFTSPALTPSFTPSLSPLATRSPAVSPVNDGRGMVLSSHGSGPNTTIGHPLSLLNNNQYGFSSSSSEQEIQI